jgi:hypothetical protein
VLASADLWTFVILALVLKIPILGLLWVLWKAATLDDRARPAPGPPIERMMLCAYCGTRITVGYDAVRLNAEASDISVSTGQAAFDVESRLVHKELAQPGHFALEPRTCPGCGEQGVWVDIDPLEAVMAAAVDPARPKE